MNGQLERDLSDGLRALADRAPAKPGWAGIQRRVVQRRRARRLQRTALASLLVLVAIGGLTSVVTRDGGRQVVAGPSGEAVSTVRYVADVAGYHALSATESDAGPPAPAVEGGTLTVLTRADGGYSGPVLFARTVPAGVPYGFGESSPSAVTVDVGGRTAYVQPMSSLSRSVGWTLADGSGVHLVSVRLSQDELLAAARGLTVAAGGAAWAPGSVPQGLEVRRSTRVIHESSASAEAAYAGPQGKTFAVQIKAGGDYLVDNFVADRAGSARQLTEVEVGGVPAALSTYDEGDRRSLIWAVAPGLMAEIDAVDMSDADVVAVAESIRPATEDEWARLLALPRGPSPAHQDNIRSLVTLSDTRCQARAEWLAAVARGDGAGQVAAAEELANLLARQRAEGVQPNGDIFLVVDRLVRAMRAGDVAAVDAQACN